MGIMTMKALHFLKKLSRRSISLWRAPTAAVLLLLPLFSAQALAVSMTDIGFNALPGGKFEVRMKFDGAPPSPQSYTIEKPARIALDLPGVSSALAQKKHALSFENAQSVVVVEASGRTRVIVNLVQVAPYETTVEGDELVLIGLEYKVADGPVAAVIVGSQGPGIDLNDPHLNRAQVVGIHNHFPRHLVGRPDDGLGLAGQLFRE